MVVSDVAMEGVAREFEQSLGNQCKSLGISLGKGAMGDLALLRKSRTVCR